MWVWTCRAGFEDDLAEELARAGRAVAPGVLGPALVTSAARPATWPVFARAGFELAAEAAPSEAPAALAGALDAAFRGTPKAWLLQAWVPDADATNPLSGRAAALERETVAAIARARPDLELRRVPEAGDAVRYGGWLAQLCLLAPDRVLVGSVAAADAATLAPGGRARESMPRGSPSRAARKLVEAIEWIGRGPEPGDLCVDLGAAPGGWTVVLLERRARVIAVDPAQLAPNVRSRRGVTHVRASAFDFAPPERVDWLCCDMAWRPLEVAQLLAKWGRRRWANALVANVKLPMKRRVELVQRVLKMAAEAGWRDLRARHLYHDRHEFTVTARRP